MRALVMAKFSRVWAAPCHARLAGIGYRALQGAPSLMPCLCQLRAHVKLSVDLCNSYIIANWSIFSHTKPGIARFVQHALQELPPFSWCHLYPDSSQVKIALRCQVGVLAYPSCRGGYARPRCRDIYLLHCYLHYLVCTG
jgi:hypothetical protein